MRQKLAFVLGLLLGVAAMRLFARRGLPLRRGVSDPRTEELRRKLAEQRRTQFERAPSAPSGPSPSAPLPGTERPGAQAGTQQRHDPAGERKRIYAEGRAAIDEMRRSGEPRAGST